MSARACSAIEIPLEGLDLAQGNGPEPERDRVSPLGISDGPDVALDLSNRTLPVTLPLRLRLRWFIRRIIEQMFYGNA